MANIYISDIFLKIAVPCCQNS